MSQHPNARLTPWGRQRLVERIEAGEAVGEAARQMGASRQTASKWVARARRGEPLSDRPGRPARLGRLTAPEDEARVVEARTSLLLAPHALSAVAGVPARTCARIVARAGLPGLADVGRVTGEPRRRGPVTRVRYERERPGELLHVDVKKVARIPDGGGAGGPAAPPGSTTGTPRRARPARTRPSTTGAAPPTPSCSRTRGRRPAWRSWAGASASSRGWASRSSAS